MIADLPLRSILAVTILALGMSLAPSAGMTGAKSVSVGCVLCNLIPR